MKIHSYIIISLFIFILFILIDYSNGNDLNSQDLNTFLSKIGLIKRNSNKK
jgi:hypothetical protein